MTSFHRCPGLLAVLTRWHAATPALIGGRVLIRARPRSSAAKGSVGDALGLVSPFPRDAQKRARRM